MKSTLALALILVSSSAFAMSEKDISCYSAQNPGAIMVEPLDGNPEMSIGVEADMRVATQVYSKQEDGHNSELRTANLKVRTNLEWKVDVGAFLNDAFKANAPTYSVECDGGSMTLKELADGTLLLNSDYIAGEMTRLDEGCSSAKLQFKDLVMKKSVCK